MARRYAHCHLRTENHRYVPMLLRGLTGSEIGSILARLGIPDPMPTMTKRHRLFEALAKRQVQTRSGNVVGALIQKVSAVSLVIQAELTQQKMW